MIKFLCKIAHKILNKYEPFDIFEMGFTTKEGKVFKNVAWECNIDGSEIKITFARIE